MSATEKKLLFLTLASMLNLMIVIGQFLLFRGKLPDELTKMIETSKAISENVKTVAMSYK